MTKHMVPVEEIGQGKCFRKRGGKFAYMRISDDSARFHGLDHENYVYGVCHNGKITKLHRGQPVQSVPLEIMDRNRQAEEDWNSTFARIPTTHDVMEYAYRVFDNQPRSLGQDIALAQLAEKLGMELTEEQKDLLERHR